MISYYDIRDARAAMRGLQNKPLRRRKLDIHFSIPKVVERFSFYQKKGEDYFSFLLLCRLYFEWLLVHSFARTTHLKRI